MRLGDNISLDNMSVVSVIFWEKIFTNDFYFSGRIWLPECVGGHASIVSFVFSGDGQQKQGFLAGSLSNMHPFSFKLKRFTIEQPYNGWGWLALTQSTFQTDCWLESDWFIACF